MVVPNAPIVISIVTVDSNHQPVSTLSSVTLQPTDLTWSVVPHDLPGLATTVRGGTEYGIELSTATTNPGAYEVGIAANNPYPAGHYLEYVYTPGSSSFTWTPVSGSSLLFSTFGP